MSAPTPVTRVALAVSIAPTPAHPVASVAWGLSTAIEVALTFIATVQTISVAFTDAVMGIIAQGESEGRTPCSVHLFFLFIAAKNYRSNHGKG